MFNPATVVAIGLLALAAPPAVPPAPPAPPVPLAHAMAYSWELGPAEVPASLDWSVKPSDAAGPAGMVDFQLGYHSDHHSSMIGDDVPLALLDGLTQVELDAPGQPANFVLHRDAGDFRCKGVAGQGRGVGTCVFAANPGFPAALAKRAIGEPAAYQQFQLALFDIGLPYLDELKRERYATPTVDDLVRAGTHGAGLKQLKAMDALGYHFGDVPSLVRVRDHGVSARYIEALRSSGYTGLSAEELVRLRDHGVSASFISDMRAQGYGRLAPADLARLRDHGVSAGYVDSLRAEGYDRLTPEELIRLRDHGVTAGFASSANRDGGRLSTDELIRLRDTGGRR